ncbi:MAG: PAS domain-containing protein [Rhodospirillales bacterium]
MTQVLGPADPRVIHGVSEPDLEIDQRLLGLFRLWNAKRRGRKLPARADLRPEELKPWLGNLIVLDVIDGGRDFRYRLFGTNIVRQAGFDMTGKLMSEYPIKDALPHFFETHRDVVRLATPALGEHNPRVALVRRRRRLILPFGEDGETVDRTITANYAIEVVREPDRYL